MSVEAVRPSAEAAVTLWGGHADPPCLLESLALTALRQADAVAVVDKEYELTYAQLLAWSRSIAGVLVEHGVGAEDRVAVSGARSAPVVAAMLATLTLGATYVPLDREYPAKRLAFMVEDSGASVLLYAGEAPVFATGTVTVPVPDRPGTAPPEFPAVAHRDDLPVYVIYTSGSTGRPKGVSLPHRCIDTMAQWQRSHSVRPDLRTAQFAPLNFDVWFQEVLGTLCGGGTLVVMPEHLRRDPIALLDWLVANRIERLFLPYVALNMVTLAASGEDSLDALALREINTAGEQVVCTPAIREFFRRVPGCRLNNHYGQSESAMVTVHTLAGPSDTWPALPPIGAPLPGCELLIDPIDGDSPDTGELLVAGAPLSLGYLNRPDLNALRYVPVGPTPHGHDVAFRTGDLVRVEGGTVHFVSRLDNEVKIRGVRVNPLEVDACLLDQPGVGEAVCVAVEVAEGSRQLHAAVTVTGPDAEFDGARSRRLLAEVLPEQYVPVSVTVVAELPRTPSGKIDRDAVARMLVPGRGR
jgi:amino acid adenylation domain-containing protein